MNEKCIESIPYASAIGFILMLFGCGVFSGTIWVGSDRISSLFKDQFFQIHEPVYIRNFGVIYAIITLIIAFIILMYGATLTGKTRQKLFESDNNSDNHHGGAKLSGGLLLGCCYVLLIGWIVLAIGGMVSVSIYLMISSVCRHEMEYWKSINTNKDSAKFTYSFNLSNYGIYREGGIGSSKIDTDGGMTQFCSEMSTIGPLFSVSFACCLLILISLLTFISALASNLVRLKYLPELAIFSSAHYDDAASYQHNMTTTTAGMVGGGGGGGGDPYLPQSQQLYHNNNYNQSHLTQTTNYPMEMQPLTAVNNNSHVNNQHQFPNTSLV